MEGFLAPTRRRLIWLGLFAVAMAQLEATVMIYLRALYYPDGFTFPLVIIRDRIALIEIGREATTLVMLASVAMVSSADSWRRWAAFLFTFGVWDLFYYLWLKVMLDWPASLLTWDVLFLIPAPWVGPVLSAAAIAAVMIVCALVIEWLRDHGRPIQVDWTGWLVTAASALGLLSAFMFEARSVLDGLAPGPFPWLLWGGSLAPALAVAAVAAARALRSSPRGEADVEQP